MADQNLKEKFDSFVKKIEVLKKNGGVDLTTAEDLSLAVMNLISLEEHFFFTANKLGKPEYFDASEDIRTMRKELLGKLIDKGHHEGETWCVSKHLLSAAMRLMEVGNKHMTDGNKEEAIDYFHKSYKIYSIFWALRMKLIEPKNLLEAKKEGEAPWSVEDLVAKLADCCSE